MTEKRDTYLEREELFKKVRKLEKAITNHENRIEVIDSNSFDTTKNEKMDKIYKKIETKENQLKELKEQIKELLTIQTKVDIIT